MAACLPEGKKLCLGLARSLEHHWKLTASVPCPLPATQQGAQQWPCWLEKSKTSQDDSAAVRYTSEYNCIKNNPFNNSEVLMYVL